MLPFVGVLAQREDRGVFEEQKVSLLGGDLRGQLALKRPRFVELQNPEPANFDLHGNVTTRMS